MISHFQQLCSDTVRIQEQMISISKGPHCLQNVIQMPYFRPCVIWTLKTPSQCFIASFLTRQSNWTTFATYACSDTNPRS